MAVVPQNKNDFVDSISAAEWNEIASNVQGAVSGADGSIAGKLVDGKRIAGIRIATEFDTAKHAGTDADPSNLAAVQSMMNDIPIADSFGVAGMGFLPAGIYRGAGGISRANPQSVTIEGTGRSTLLDATGSADVLTLGDGTAGRESVTVRDLTIRMAASSSAIKALYLKSIRYCLIHNVRVFGNATTMNQTALQIEGIGNFGCWTNTISHFNSAFTQRGIYLLGLATAQVNFINIVASFCGGNAKEAGSVGFQHEYGDSNTAQDLDLENFETAFRLWTTSTRGHYDGIRIESCTNGIQFKDFDTGYNRIIGGNAVFGVTNKVVDGGGFANLILRNPDIATANHGSATILTGTKTLVVSHGLISAPTMALVCWQDDTFDGGPVGAHTYTASNFTIACQNNVAANRGVRWLAKTKYAAEVF